MPKITEEPLTAIQVRLYEADLVKLRSLYGQDLGVNGAIRAIIRTFLRQVDAKAAKTINEQKQEEKLLATMLPENILADAREDSL